MANHNFSFAGGDILTHMGAAWFVSYAYYDKIDKNHKNWANISTSQSRISNYKKGCAFHKVWLQEILLMNPMRLEKNTIGLNSQRIKIMAKQLLDIQATDTPVVYISADPVPIVDQRPLIACKSQFIFDDFIGRYEQKLISLDNNPGFISELIEARGSVTPEIEFCTDQNNSDLRRFKDQINQHLHNANVYYDYPDFQAIVDDVQSVGIKTRGKAYAKKSAYISVYYALRYIKLLKK